MNIVFVGHVDHGKSTLIGRLLADTLPRQRVEQAKEQAAAQGKEFEYAFLLDAFEEEQRQGITIDTTRIEFSHDGRHYTIIDAPGHKEFVKNMVGGAARADAAVLIVDAKESVREQTRQHALLISLLGIRQVVVAINKMDTIGYDRKRYEKVRDDVLAYCGRLDMEPTVFVPIAARPGENVRTPSQEMPWHDGTFLDALARLTHEHRHGTLRLPIQDAYKFDDRRIVAGRLESGELEPGQEVLISPSRHVSRVKTIEGWPRSSKSAEAGSSTGITLEDEYYFKRGEVISLRERPPSVNSLLRCNIFWLGEEPLTVGGQYRLRLQTQDVRCEVHTIDRVMDAETLEEAEKVAIERDDVGTIVLRTKRPVVFDPFTDVPGMGRFVLVDEHVVGGGIIRQQVEELEARPDVRTKSELVSPRAGLVRRDERERRHGHQGAVVWITGLPGSGKGRIAKHLERELWDAGKEVYCLNASTLRFTLTSDLDFSKKARHEQARRIAEVANLFANAGFIVIVNVVSPYADDRKKAREIIGPDRYHEILVDAPIDLCRRNDPHGIYARADAGEITNVPGVHFPYEDAAYEVTRLEAGADTADLVRAIMEGLHD